MGLTPIVLVGAGGHARELLDLVDAINDHRPTYEVLGVASTEAPDPALIAPWGLPWLGGDEAVRALPTSIGVVLGIGAPAVRARLDTVFDHRPAPVLVHPQTSLGRRVELGPGSVVCAFVSLTNHIRLDRHVHLNRGATVGHDVRIGSHTLVGPQAAVSGNVTIGEGVLVGTAAALREGVSVGDRAVVGMGAAVIEDVASGATVVGVPAQAR